MLKKLFIIAVAVFIAAVTYYFLFPNVSRLKTENPKKTSFMEYREREWSEQGKKLKIIQTWVPLANISPYLIKAVLIGEDDKFWKHEGFDIDAMEKAMEKNIKAKKFKAGGSTISQQLAKNLYLTPSKNPVRKLKEAILTWRIERRLSKKRILELYLNVAEWGEGIFGIEAASRHYYGKPSIDISAEEASRLAAALPNPRKYVPTGSSRYIENRSRIIYNIMVKRGIVIPSYNEVTEKGDAEIMPSDTAAPEGSDSVEYKK
jgi:monofunctional biosynthetic peptidoglycan transglycosylase